MAEAALGRRTFAIPSSRVEAREWVIENWAVLALAGLMIVAAGLRFWDLGSRALHHDESLHATFSNYLYEGRGYKHDPLMHGTFLFDLGALVYFLFGVTDYTARVGAALFGTALVGMPFLLRKQIGIKAALIAAVFLTFSPTLLYFGRFDRNEAWMAVWTLGVVICIWRYLEDQKNGWLYAMAALLALSFASKEVTFISVAVMLVFIDLMLAVELGRRREDETVEARTIALRTLALVPVAWAIAALWPVMGRRPLGWERLPPIGDVMVLLGTLSLPQFAAAVQVLPFVDNKGYFPLSTITTATPEDNLRVTTVVILLIVSAYVGLLWKPRVWAMAAGFFYVPYVLLLTTFFTNQPAPWTSAFWHGRGGFFSGIWGSLDYWLAQHDVKRGDQPGYYYLLLTPLYEFLPLLLALGGAVWMAIKGDSLKRWLLFWLAGMFVGLSLAGEKMPWLEVHLALPLALIGAVALSAAMDALGFSLKGWQRLAALAAVSSLSVILMVSLDSTSAHYTGYALIGLALGWTAWSAFAEGWRPGARSALTVAVAVLFTLTVRAATMASFQHGDIPVEMLVYTQTSPDIPKLRDRIDALAEESGLGKNLPIVVDATDGFSWPWAWYLRDYHEVQYPVVSQGFKPPENAVLLIAQSNAQLIDASTYTTTPYKHRWWFCESYRDRAGSCRVDGQMNVSDFAYKLTHWDSLKSLGKFFLYRRDAATKTGSVNGIAFFPQTLAGFDVGNQPLKPAPAPTRLDDGRIVIGQAGSGQGEFAAPADVFVDRDGNVWVADTNNDRIQKFDREGNFVATLGGGGTAPGRFKQPWSVAVDSDGFIYVADTWNHRIQKFAPDLSRVGGWGEPYYGPNPGPFQIFGPRDIAIGPDGTLWVTDTGNKRIVNYSRSGDFIRSVGGPGSDLGQFNEQVGLAFDQAGGLYVADTWNQRIQRFSPGLDSQTAYAAGWTSTDAANKPYLAILSDGRVVASDPGRGLLMLFDFRNPIKAWKPADGARPVGVTALADGGFVFADAARNEVQIVPGSAVSRLFR